MKFGQTKEMTVFYLFYLCKCLSKYLIPPIKYQEKRNLEKKKTVSFGQKNKLSGFLNF